MKSVIHERPAEGKKFPRLGVYTDNTVVLFSSPNRGVVVHQGVPHSQWTIGHMGDTFPSSWRDFRGTVTLESD